MRHHPVAGAESGQHLRRQAGTLADLDRRQARASAIQPKHRPALALAEQRAARQLQHVLALPQHETRFHAVAVAEARPRGPWRSEVDDDAYPLLLDAERRDLRIAA